MTHAPIPFVGTNGQNFTPGRHGQAPLAIVHHVMLGTLGGTRAAFADPAHQASAHYGIGADGTILQFVRDDDMAWANGPIRQPNLDAVPWIRPLCLVKGINPNDLTLSIEWEGMHGGAQWEKVWWQNKRLDTIRRGTIAQWWTPTEAQYAAGVWLTEKLLTEHDITRTRAYICRHSDFDNVAKWFCPGTSPRAGEGFPMLRLLHDVGATI